MRATSVRFTTKKKYKTEEKHATILHPTQDLANNLKPNEVKNSSFNLSTRYNSADSFKFKSCKNRAKSSDCETAVTLEFRKIKDFII